ncbi:MAG: gluconate 2-dehydrogenase subunit 3 family protein [Alphaproteobacteria bacterium]|nr:gluconate 2-dehydrogenase subunit 3 family protein [Alphaproteobacteria bacterium]
MRFHRRELLAGTALLLLSAPSVSAATISGQLPWAPNAGDPPVPARPGPWQFFTGPEGEAMEAIADRIIPPDPQTPGGKDAGCAVFVDRQLAGPYGRADGLYNGAPFQKGAKNQGPQSEGGPSVEYRKSLAALDKACKAKFSNKGFAALSDADKDTVLKGLESGELALEGADGKTFMEHLVRDVQMGFFADPLYGGNRDMAAWKMIGFPGARYNYLDWIDHHNERFPLPPVSIVGRPEWTPHS